MARDAINILRAASVELRVTDLKKSRNFYENILGFVVTKETEKQIYLRGVEERVHHSLVLTKADVPAVAHLGFRVESEEDVEKLYRLYRDRGCYARYMEKDEELGLKSAILVKDPFGFPIQYFAAIEQAQSYNQLYHLHRGGAVRRIDHFNVFAPDFNPAFDFWTQELGFRLTEYVETDEEPRERQAAWLHRKPSVHDLAIMRGNGPRLHHIGFWMEDIMSIVHTCDILGASELHEQIERGPGRHGISNAFFLYLRDPDGHRIELYTSDYLTLDPDLQPIRWSATDPRRQTLWGHKTPESWWRDGSSVVDAASNLLVPAQPVSSVEGIERFVR